VNVHWRKGEVVLKERKFSRQTYFWSGMNIFFTHVVTIIGEREREDKYAVCSFIFLSLILMMMMMFRTVLLFSLCLHNAEKEKKTGTFLKDDKTCLLVPRSGLNSAIVMFHSCSSFFSSSPKAPPLHFPISFFLFFYPLCSQLRV